MSDVNHRIVSAVTLDQPAVWGRIAENGHHWARNWEPEYDPNDVLSVPWVHSGTELIESLHALAPATYVEWSDMSWPHWQAVTGEQYWRLDKPALTQPQIDFLSYTRVTSSLHYAQAVSKTTYRPGVRYRFLRYQAVHGQTGTPYVTIEHCGSPGQYGYALAIPFGDTRLGSTIPTQPQLWQYAYEDGFDVTDEPFAETAPICDRMIDGSRPLLQDVEIEQLGDYLRIRISGQPEDWIVDTGGHPLVRGFVRTTIYNHAAMFAAATIRISQPDGATAYPRKHVAVPSWCVGGAGAANYELVGDAPADTLITATENVGETDRYTRPVVAFTLGATADLRPLLYRIQQHNTPTLETEASDPTTIYPERTPRWSRSNDWRGAWFEADRKDLSNELPLAANGTASLALAWDTGGAPPTPTARIEGHLDDTENRYIGREWWGGAQPRIRVSDCVMSELADKKFWRQLCSFEGWGAGDTFRYLLSTWGVPSGRVSVSAAVEAMTIPYGEPAWVAQGDFEQDYSAVAGLDAIFRDLLGVQWGCTVGGYFVRETPAYSGTPDWTLNYDSTDDLDIVTEMRVARSWSEFRNYVMVANDTGDGVVASDKGSHLTSTDPRYIGQDWWATLHANAGDSMAYLAVRRIAELARFGLMIEWECERLDIAPDMFVLVDSHPDPAIPDNTVFRILDEDGKPGQSAALDAVITYTAGVEQYAE